MERVGELTGGLVGVNPNTMYPLLRALEAEGLVAGEWEHPERRSRRFYRLTEDGRAAARRAGLRARPAPGRARGRASTSCGASCSADRRSAAVIDFPRPPAAPPTTRSSHKVFVFKAAVVGAGTMGGEIAQVIASAGIPVVLKDVKQEFVDLGLKKAEEVTQRAARKPRPQAEDQRGAGRRAGRADPRPDQRDDGLRRLRRRRLRHRGRAGADGDQAGGARRARRLHARPRDPRVEHVGALDLGDGARDAAAPTRSSAFTSSIPRR